MSKIVDGIIKDLSSIPKNLKKRVKKIGAKKYCLMLIPYLVVAYFVNKFYYLWRVSPGIIISDKLTNYINALNNHLDFEGNLFFELYEYNPNIWNNFIEKR